MKIILALAISSILAFPAYAADEKIDPQTYICAELVASSIDGQPPLFEGLQLDGFAAGLANMPVADANIMEPMLLTVSDSCVSKPAEKALAHWQEARKAAYLPEDGPWRADKTTCGDYQANPDDGSGFVIWLDAYQRARNGKTASVFADQQTLDKFLEVCKANPGRLMIDVMAENAK